MFFLNNSIDPERVLKKYQANIDEKAQPLWKEIMEVENPNKDEQEKIFKKIMVYINMTYLLGSPTNAKVGQVYLFSEMLLICRAGPFRNLSCSEECSIPS